MAKGVRGKLKENLEGIHRNCDWITQHCQKSIEIIPADQRYENLIQGFDGIAKLIEQVDKFALDMYSRV